MTYLPTLLRSLPISQTPFRKASSKASRSAPGRWGGARREELKKKWNRASRVADRAGFFLNSEMIEVGPAYQIFTKPEDKRTEDYVTGRFG